jgi:hypothetical protein
MCFESKDIDPICPHIHAIAFGCEPEAKVVTFVPSIQFIYLLLKWA